MKVLHLLVLAAALSSCEPSPKSPIEDKTILVNSRYCSAFDTINHSGLKIQIDLPSDRQLYQITTILNRISLPQNFVVYQGNVNNAIAFCQDNQNYIILNRNFLNDVDNRTSDYWLSMYLISHEIGHLLSSHLLNQSVSDSVSKVQELQADYFAGATLSRLRCPIDKAKLIFNGTYLQKAQGSKTHPPSALRIKFIENGWENNRLSIFTEAPPPVPDNIQEINSKDPNYTFTLLDLSPESIPEWYASGKSKQNENDNIGEGVIIDFIPLKEVEYEGIGSGDDYVHNDRQLKKIEAGKDAMEVLDYAATIQVREWLKTNEINPTTSSLTIKFRVHEINWGNEHLLDPLLDLFRFAYNKKKLDIYSNHFVVGQPIRFTIEHNIDEENKNEYYFKSFQFLTK